MDTSKGRSTKKKRTTFTHISMHPNIPPNNVAPLGMKSMIFNEKKFDKK